MILLNSRCACTDIYINLRDGSRYENIKVKQKVGLSNFYAK